MAAFPLGKLPLVIHTVKLPARLLLFYIALLSTSFANIH
jgi:hypothetical protein